MRGPLELRDCEKGFAGINQNFEQIGAAVHSLIGMLHRGELGVPATAQKILIDGTWTDGDTLGHV
ncbi:hypothetical protein OVA24_11910 [Luteolibacter sp. SL250]|uniref:hypothetical protein n=1 Tax=Luteolibacter sp. SL250 TaxID=2995170 RepID=UPI00226EB8FC|nr:hypothetical protein [Luteolibacter sp. SL250]WAC17943.1 hypothetical protein OVA24_11910 [Luteolibacter sp. SL250]